MSSGEVLPPCGGGHLSLGHGHALFWVTQRNVCNTPVSQGSGLQQRPEVASLSPLGIEPMVSSKCKSKRGSLGLYTGGPQLPSGLLPSFRLAQIPGLVNSATANPEAGCLPSRTPPRVGSPWRPLHHARKVEAESDGSTEETDESET